MPGGVERISYQIPAVTVAGNDVVYFAAWKRHISVYPVPAGVEDFEAAIAPYRAAKGTLKFPLGTPLPLDLIGRVARALNTAA